MTGSQTLNRDMNTHPFHFPKKTGLAPRRAFTLIELLVVMVIIAILVGLTFGGFRYARDASMRNHTTATLNAIVSGLENYKSEYGEFPAPANPGNTDEFRKKTIQVGGAKMLYQALSGDGSNEIQIASGGGKASDGKWDADEKMMLVDLPKEIYSINKVNRYMLFDGYLQPFQYTKGGSTDAINPTFDLWSFGAYGDQGESLTSVGREAKQNSKSTSKWIVNWK